MGLLDTILGRTKPVRPNLDALFALPGAAVTLQASAGLVPTGQAGVCFKPPAGQAFTQMQADVEQLLRTPDEPDGVTGATTDPGDGAPALPAAVDGDARPTSDGGSDGGPASSGGAGLSVRHVGDSFGYRWIVIDGAGIDDIVTRVHMVHSSLEDAGWGPQLLCSVFGFQAGPEAGADPDALGGDAVERTVYLVYLAKRGTFYPFAPSGQGEQRLNELELRIRSIVGSDLPVEDDLARWFPLWGLPLR
jgi:hypothetical protein